MMPFDSLSPDYERFRPRYPGALLHEFVQYCGDEPGPKAIIDVGCGTGISTRALRDAFGPRPSIAGIEPAEGMIAAALSATADIDIRYIRAKADDLPAADGSTDVVFAAQAIQWFDRPTFYGEAARVLVPRRGALGICQNNRDWSGDPFLKAYETLLERYSPAYTRDYRAFDIERELHALPWMGDVFVTRERWSMTGDIDAFVGLAFSSTKMKSAAEMHGYATMQTAVRELAREYAIDGMISVPYVSELYAGRKA